MLELAAQIVEREGVGIGVVDLSKDKKLAKKLQIFEIGAIWCFHRGHEVEFNGQRSADVLVEFLLELDEFPVEDINNKKVRFFEFSFHNSSKKELESFLRDDSSKVVSFIDTKKSVAYDEFVDASLDFVPLVSFYTVSNKQLAKSLGMKTVG